MQAAMPLKDMATSTSAYILVRCVASTLPSTSPLTKLGAQCTGWYNRHLDRRRDLRERVAAQAAPDPGVQPHRQLHRHEQSFGTHTHPGQESITFATKELG